MTEPEVPAPRRGGRLATLFAWSTVALLLGLWSVTFLGRTWRSPPWPVTAAVTFLPFLYGALLAWGFLLWALLPDRRSVPIALTGALVTGAALWGPSWPARPEVADGDPLVVMQWNARRLWGGPADGRDPLRCVVDAVTAEAPDAVAFEEVSLANLSRIERATDLVCGHALYREGDTGRGGLAVCARGGRWRLDRLLPYRYVDDDPWRYALAELRHGDDVVNLLAVHLSPYGFRVDRLRRALTESPDQLLELAPNARAIGTAQNDQAAALLDRVARLKDPTVLAGDFNSTRDSALHVALRRHLTDAWERGGRGFGSTFDLLDRIPIRIDYVYATRDFAVRGARIPEVGCSDHRPMVAELVLRR